MGSMSGSAVRVVKIGGSLLDYPRLVEAWNEWLFREPRMATVVIGGGGPYADLIRDWDRRFLLGEETAHWMCVASMNITATLLHQRLSGVSFIDDWQSLGEWIGSGQLHATTVFSVESFLKTIEEDLPGDQLPRSWAVSSDSIAARVAEAMGAEELVLGKSTSPSPARDWQQLSDEGFVDQYFPEIATRLPAIRWVNLRSITAAKTRQ
jgi:aspartokinase-like uncharacterized kinase